jgi:hypothetical protein
MARSTVCPTVETKRSCKSMTGVGIEPTTYGKKGTLRTPPNVAGCQTLRGKVRHPVTWFSALYGILSHSNWFANWSTCRIWQGAAPKEPPPGLG